MRNSLVAFIMLLMFASCATLNPEQMLRTPKDFSFNDPGELAHIDQYRLSPNDVIDFRLFTNDGERFIDPTTTAMGQNLQQHVPSFRLEHDGKVKLPVLGFVALEGMTTREAEAFLEKEFSRFYNRPFVQIRVINSRVIIFPGGRGGTSLVVNLENKNTTLFEALAKAGGIADGKASRVKLIRNTDEQPRIYLINLSSVESIQYGNIVLQSNDIIYVEPRERLPQRILETLSPYLSLLSAALLVYTLFSQ